MIYHQAKDPDSYQTIFYKQIGLKRRSASLPENDWANDQIGSIYTYGRMDSIQFGIGDYTIPEDFLVEFQYNTEYLHAGIIYEGITYSLVENRMEQSAIPSPFRSRHFLRLNRQAVVSTVGKRDSILKEWKFQLRPTI